MQDKTKRGFTLIELLVVIAIIAVLAAILFPVFTAAKERAYQAQCMANLKQIGVATMLYQNDNNSRFPLWWSDSNKNVGWLGAVQKYAKAKLLAKCPMVKNKASVSYWRNVYTDFWSTPGSAVPPPMINQILRLKTTVFVMDGPASGNDAGWHTWPGPPTTCPPATAGCTAKDMMDAETRHGGGANILFVDGHTKQVKYGDITTTSTDTAHDPLDQAEGGPGYFYGTSAQKRNDGSHPWFRSN